MFILLTGTMYTTYILHYIVYITNHLLFLYLYLLIRFELKVYTTRIDFEECLTVLTLPRFVFTELLSVSFGIYIKNV